jgi:hypothetical protein
VRVWSVEGEGSTFTIILPSYTEQLPDESPPDLEITPGSLIGQHQEVP